MLHAWLVSAAIATGHSHLTLADTWLVAVCILREERKPIDNDAKLTALLSSSLVFPSILLEAAVDKDWPALGKVLPNDLGSLAKGGAVDEVSRIVPLATIYGKAEISNAHFVREELGFDITGQSAEEGYRVVCGHLV